MKYVKILGLLAVAAAAMMAFAGVASADQITSPTGTTYTGSLTSKAEGHAVLDNPIATIDCASEVKGSVENHGGAEVSGKISSLTFGSPVGTCTNDWHVTVAAAGEISVDHTTGYNGTVYSKGATVESTRFGVNCRYATTAKTKIGTITGGSPATMHIEAAIPFHSGSFLCGEEDTTWTGSYEVTSPTSVYVD